MIDLNDENKNQLTLLLANLLGKNTSDFTESSKLSPEDFCKSVFFNVLSASYSGGGMEFRYRYTSSGEMQRDEMPSSSTYHSIPEGQIQRKLKEKITQRLSPVANFFMANHSKYEQFMDEISTSVYSNKSYYTCSEKPDYWGNKNIYQIYHVNIGEIIKNLKKHHLINEEVELFLTQTAEDIITPELNELTRQNNSKRITALESEIARCETIYAKEKEAIGSQIKEAQALVDKLKDRLTDLESKQENQLNFLLTQIEELNAATKCNNQEKSSRVKSTF